MTHLWLSMATEGPASSAREAGPWSKVDTRADRASAVVHIYCPWAASFVHRFPAWGASEIAGRGHKRRNWR